MKNEWKVNYDMDDDNGNHTQWINDDYPKVMIDLGAHGKYMINVFLSKTNDFYYFNFETSTLEEAIDFVEEIWKRS